MADELAAFVLERLREDEADARAAQHDDAVTPGTWTTDPSWPESSPNLFVSEDRSGHYWTVGELYAPIAVHVARQDPAATLARVTALRALVALHEPGTYEQPDPPYGKVLMCDADVSVDCETGAAGEWPCATLRHVAAIWRHHPGWRGEWAP